MSKKITVSVIKADVGSIGGHTKPSKKMIARAEELVREAVSHTLIIDGLVQYTGDDICLIMSHTWGEGAPLIHKFCWDIFKEATALAEQQGCYGAGQDLLVDAPSGNVRGAGPAVAEIEFVRDRSSGYRPVETFLVFAADKCGPGVFNMPFYQTFCDPMHNGGLLLKPEMNKGFTLTVIDMDHKGKDDDRVVDLIVPERVWDVAVLLRDMDRYGIEKVFSRHVPHEQVAAVSATRLHNIAGKYTGKDDPVALVRTQGIFPSPEELVEPWMLGHYVTGDCRGSHVMPIVPVAVRTPVAGPYCLPIVSCVAFSMDENGCFSEEVFDVFGDSIWDPIRDGIVRKAKEFRRQGFFGVTMASQAELSYTGITNAISRLNSDFHQRKN